MEATSVSDYCGSSYTETSPAVGADEAAVKEIHDILQTYFRVLFFKQKKYEMIWFLEFK